MIEPRPYTKFAELTGSFAGNPWISRISDRIILAALGLEPEGSYDGAGLEAAALLRKLETVRGLYSQRYQGDEIIFSFVDGSAILIGPEYWEC